LLDTSPSAPCEADDDLLHGPPVPLGVGRGHVVVIAARNADEPLGRRDYGIEQLPALCDRNDMVSVAVQDENRN
jgi:hypothetical protein